MTEIAQVVRSACPSAVIDGEALQRFANALHISGSGSASARLQAHARGQWPVLEVRPMW